MPDDSLSPPPQPTASVGWEPELAELRARVAIAKEMGGAERVARQHKGGRLTVRERIDRMLDAGSFHEIGATAGKATYDADANQPTFTDGATHWALTPAGLVSWADQPAAPSDATPTS